MKTKEKGSIAIQPQYAILRFAKYKGPEIGRIEAHNERTKETYASNPDVDLSRSKDNFHLVEPERAYRAEAERQIAAAGCWTRSDSVRVVEALFTASPEFFQGKKPDEIRAFFREAMDFLSIYQSKETIISAVVHMDEKTPHMHLSFVPLTADGRLCAKEIVGNKKKLTWWQDEFWKHMVKKFPELERGQSASETGRDHIPPRIFKEMTRLDKQRQKLEELLAGVTTFNAKSRIEAIQALLEKYIPNVERMQNQLKRYSGAFTDTAAENKRLKAEVAVLKGEKAELEKQLRPPPPRASGSACKPPSSRRITRKPEACSPGFPRRSCGTTPPTPAQSPAEPYQTAPEKGTCWNESGTGQNTVYICKNRIFAHRRSSDGTVPRRSSFY